MTDREIYAYYHSGVMEQVKKAKEVLITQNKTFIKFLMKKHYATYVDKIYEDLMQSGFEGLLKALKTYDPDKGKLSTYSVSFIRHEMSQQVAFYRHERSPYFVALQDTVHAIANDCAKEGRPLNKEIIVKKTGWSEKKAARELYVSSFSFSSLDFMIEKWRRCEENAS